ncbi:MAG: L-serine ammonia-lyase, iron-sulfur-dependent, subunit alpha [Clostridia bacterium]|nr:L-serine ammonia-lyase, iron-sulfur-dependent, subunit alpha [Clostridia bacterium]
MKSLKELYRIGIGPSSSHTMAPYAACNQIKCNHGKNAVYTVTLYGSLSATGKGHGTDEVIRRALGKNTKVIFDDGKIDIAHPNTMKVVVQDDITVEYLVESLGGGAYSINGSGESFPEVYSEKNFAQIKEYCQLNGIRLYEYVYKKEKNIKDYLFKVWQSMKNSVQEGLVADGILPGGLNIERKAKYLYGQVNVYESPSTIENMLVCAYAFAVAEQNAAGGTVVTAPTCGASGVLPACLMYMQKKHSFSDEKIVNAIATAGVIGNLIKQNASISGAECGCQAEIGSACSMASAALAELFNMDIDQIEYAAEVAMEHYLGLTCDPVCGLVQIPCIERNAVAAMRAINALSLARFLTHTRKISFDVIVKTMYETGKDLNKIYKETSKGGLAAAYENKN